MTGKPSVARQKPVTDPRRAHRALHGFTDDLRRKLNKAVTCARSRQFGAARHVEQVIRDLLSRDKVEGNNGMVIGADLEDGLKHLDAKDLVHRGEAWADAIHALEEFEGVPIPRKPLRLGARRKAADSPADEREAELVKSLEAEANQILDVFKAATVKILRSGTARKRKPAAHSDDGTLSPKQVAERLGVSVDKIRGFITNGDLNATNVASPNSSRPRWRISEADLIEFQRRRQSTKPTPTAKRRLRKRDEVVKEYF